MEVMNIMPGMPAAAAAQTAGPGSQNAGAPGDFAQLVLAEMNQLLGTGKGQAKDAKPTDALMALLSMLTPANAQQAQGGTVQGADAADTAVQTADAAQTDDADQNVLELNFADMLALFLPLLQQRQMDAQAQAAEATDAQAAQAVGAAGAQPTGDALLQGLMQALTAQATQGQAADAGQGAQAQPTQQDAQPVQAALPSTENLNDAVAQIRDLFAKLITPETEPELEQRLKQLQQMLDAQAEAAAPQAVAAAAATAAEAPAQAVAAKTDAVQTAIPANFPIEAEQPVAAGIAVMPQQKASDSEAGFSSTYQNEQSLADTQTASKPAAKAAAPAQTSASHSIAFTPALDHAKKNETAAEKSNEALNSGREVFDKIVGKISAMQAEGRQEMQIQLKPEYLGKVVIKLTMENGSLVAKITAANAGVQEAFAAQAQTLQNSLQESGLKDVRVVVDATGVQDTGMRQQGRQGGNQRENARRNWAAVDAAEKAKAGRAMQAYEEYYRSGTVNFLA